MVCLTTLRFSSGPCHHGRTQQHATTSASRTMDVKPRLVLTKTLQSAKAACCKRLLGSPGHVLQIYRRDLIGRRAVSGASFRSGTFSSDLRRGRRTARTELIVR